MDALEQARAEIDTVDAQLAALFERRMAAVLQVAEYKRAHGLPIFDAAREAAVLEKAKAEGRDAVHVRAWLALPAACPSQSHITLDRFTETPGHILSLIHI